MKEEEEKEEKGGEGPLSPPPPPLLRGSKEQGPTTALSPATRGFHGAVEAVGCGDGGGDGGCTHHNSFAVRKSEAGTGTV